MWRWSLPGVRKLRGNVNFDLLSSSETGVSSGIRRWKKHSSEWAWCKKAIFGIYFTTKWRAWTLQRGLEFNNFKLRLESDILKCILWLNGLFFVGDDWDFLIEGIKTYQMEPMPRLKLPTFFSVFKSMHTGHTVHIVMFSWFIHGFTWSTLLWLHFILKSEPCSNRQDWVICVSFELKAGQTWQKLCFVTHIKHLLYSNSLHLMIQRITRNILSTLFLNLELLFRHTCYNA
jgi:hypothetical protein